MQWHRRQFVLDMAANFRLHSKELVLGKWLFQRLLSITKKEGDIGLLDLDGWTEDELLAEFGRQRTYQSAPISRMFIDCSYLDPVSNRNIFF